MLTQFPLFLVFSLLLTTALCLIARRVNTGNLVAQAFEVANIAGVKRWEMLLDVVMIGVVAGFILFIDDGDTRSSQVFLKGLFYMSILSVALAGVGYLWSRAWTSVLMRKSAFRTIMCLALFTMVLGMKASGIGDEERVDDLARLNELRR